MISPLVRGLLQGRALEGLMLVPGSSARQLYQAQGLSSRVPLFLYTT